MSEARALLIDTAAKVIAALPEHPVPAQRMWKAAGLDKVLVPEAEGGFGGGWEDVLAVLRIAGAHGDVVGLAEDMIAGSRVHRRAPDTPRREAEMNVAELALGYTCQMAGAMQAALDLSVKYVRERQQFGKPLASFQAIQQQLAVFAEECAATNMAAAAACRAADRGPALFEIACAKLRANIAVGAATSVAHQVHGAMGFTAEYKLQRLTKLLWAWRGEYGNDRYWAEWLGKLAAAQGQDGFWAALVSPATLGPLGSAD